MNHSALDMDAAVAALVDAAARAGACIMRHYAGRPAAEFKADASPVTLADREAEAILLATLAELAPSIPVISEEAVSRHGYSGALEARFFLVDPLDGTKEFLQQRDDFTVNIALIDEGRPRFGLVFAPAKKLLAVTIADGSAVETELEPSAEGASLDPLSLRPLHVRLADPKALTAVVSHSHLDAATETFLSTLPIVRTISAGSSVKFIWIARGEADVYPRLGPTMAWDTAAGHAVLTAAGGTVETLDGKPLSYARPPGALQNPPFIAWGRRRA